jgi:hypothetical protein
MRMRKRFLSSIFLLTLATVLAGSYSKAEPDAEKFDDTRFVAALKDLQSGKIKDAQEKLLQIKVSDPIYLDALTELQKIRFKKGEWQTFFGNALYYRKKFLSDKDVPSTFFRARLLSLESVALAKHCQWDMSRALAKASIDLGYSMSNPVANDLSELRQALYYIELSHEFQAPAKLQATPANGFFSSTVLWKVRGQSVAKVQNPDLLRIRVENRCGK